MKYLNNEFLRVYGDVHEIENINANFNRLHILCYGLSAFGQVVELSPIMNYSALRCFSIGVVKCRPCCKGGCG